MRYKKPVSVLVVIHTPDLDILLLERARHPGFWQSVTGSQEDGESLLQTAVREVREETGISANAPDILDWQQSNQYEIFNEWRHRYAPGVTYNEEHVFSLCVPNLAEPVRIAPDEHVRARWLPWRDAAAACFSWTNRDAILALPTKFQAQQQGSE
jgi:dATP pyrophosphohydrolase